MNETDLIVSEPLPLRGARNVRDLGGYPFRGPDGELHLTASDVFLRGDALGRLKAQDVDILRAHGLSRVVDLRSSFELRHWPDPFAGDAYPDISYVHVAMLDQLNSSGFAGSLPHSMFEVYRSLIDDDTHGMRLVIEALDVRGCALFHCRGGKDRTGVVAMLLLELAGVDDAHVIADYAATQLYMGRGLRAQRIGVSILIRRRVPRCLFEAAPAEMERTIAHVRRRYGDVYRYLVEAAGVEPVVLSRIAGRLRGKIDDAADPEERAPDARRGGPALG